MHEYPGMSTRNATIAALSLVLGIVSFAGIIALFTQL